MEPKKKELPQTVVIRRDETQPEQMELVAKAIIEIDQGFKRLLSAGATKELIVLLLHDMTKVGKPDIRAVLYAAPRIAEKYLTRKN